MFNPLLALQQALRLLVIIAIVGLAHIMFPVSAQAHDHQMHPPADQAHTPAYKVHTIDHKMHSMKPVHIAPDFRPSIPDHYLPSDTAEVEPGVRRSAYPTQAETFLNRGLDAAYRGNYQRAIALYSKTLKLAPTHDVAFLERGKARYEVKDFQGAIADFSQAMEYNPTFSSLYNLRGQAKMRAGDLAGAIADFTIAIEIYPESYDVYWLRGKLYAQVGDTAKSLKDLNQAIAINPDYALAYADRGMVRIASRDIMGATSDYQLAAKLLNQTNIADNE
jgi:tetratricopeptide (TPR) repeat protein